MSENGESEQNLPFLQVNIQYIKDLSFELPDAPMIFQELRNGAPDINVDVNVSGRTLGENVFESTLTLRVSGDLNGKPVFIAELAYAGVFTISVPKEDLQPVLLIECPRLLFPFARSIISNVTGEGGLPPIALQPIDFAGLYRQRMEQPPQGHA